MGVTCLASGRRFGSEYCNSRKSPPSLLARSLRRILTRRMNRGQTIGWSGMIRVDGIMYAWMGLPDTVAVNQTAYEYTSTKSIFTMDVDDAVQLTITFLSPITPHDFKRQSLVFSYMNVEVASIDGDFHDVQLYSDTSAGEFFFLFSLFFFWLPPANI